MAVPSLILFYCLCQERMMVSSPTTEDMSNVSWTGLDAPIIDSVGIIVRKVLKRGGPLS